jgi:hypothetical protein
VTLAVSRCLLVVLSDCVAAPISGIGDFRDRWGGELRRAVGDCGDTVEMTEMQ